MSTFTSHALLPTIQSTLKEIGLTHPTEIQQQVLPLLLRGQSVVGIAETGSGKTLAYALPMLQSIKVLEEETESVSEGGLPRAVILVPSSDLGEQVSRVFKQFTHNTRLRVRTALGSQDMVVVRRNVANPFEILIATPGRLEKLMQNGFLSLSDVQFLVFDEADQILDQGFLPAVKRVLKNSRPDRQVGLFSATASQAIESLIEDMFSEAQLVSTAGRHRPVETLKTIHLEVPNGQRFPLLEKLLEAENEGGTLIFANTREQCDNIAGLLEEQGFESAIYRGDMDKKERRDNLMKFREGSLETLICTDLAARGLDVECVGRVINYHLPREMKNYLHRIGRTARAGKKGTVYNFVTERDANLIQRIDS